MSNGVEHFLKDYEGPFVVADFDGVTAAAPVRGKEEDAAFVESVGQLLADLGRPPVKPVVGRLSWPKKEAT